MAQKIQKLPKTQVPLTNVAVVRFKHKNKRFEIACYKNKVISWRRGVEKNIDEVLQIERVFTNVSKGVAASLSDIKTVFGTEDIKQVCQTILNNGDLQVSGKERNKQILNKYKEIASIVCNKCINSETKKPFPLQTILNSMKEIHFNVNLKKSSKSQAISLIDLLKKEMPIERAQMQLKIDIPKNIGKKIKPLIEPLVCKIEKELFSIKYQMIVLIEPGQYREIFDCVAKNTKGQGSIEVLDMAVQQLGDELF